MSKKVQPLHPSVEQVVETATKFEPFPNSKGKLKVYLASPFFNEKQIATVRAIEEAVGALEGVSLFSPSRDGVVCPPDADDATRKRAFDINVVSVKQAQLVIGVLSSKDTGTTFELGMAYDAGKMIVGYSDSLDYTLNLMLAQCMVAYIENDIPLLQEFVSSACTITSQIESEIDKLTQSHDAVSEISNNLQQVILQMNVDKKTASDNAKAVEDAVVERVNRISTEFSTAWNKTLKFSEVE